MIRSISQKALIVISAFFLFATFFIYYQASDSILTLDDTPNLASLSQVASLRDAINYSFTPIAGHRYLAYLSFALQADSFKQGDFQALKLVNIVIHFLNTLLVYLLLIKLLSLDNTIKKPTVIAALISLLWLSHPIHTNTVLYTIQRMTLLSAFFVLVALNFGISYRAKAALNNKRLCILYLIFSLFTLLAILCKETGILAYAFFLFILIFYKHRLTTNSHSTQKTELLCFLAPYIALGFYLIGLNKLNYNQKDFSLFERLITQPGIITEYIDKILFAHPQKFSLFYENYIINQSAISFQFLVPSSIIVFLLASSYLQRKQQPLIALFIVFYFVGLSLESSIIPLELYFDHRNYLPSLGIISAIVIILYKAALFRPIYKIIGLVLLIFYAGNNLFATYLESNTWKSQESFTVSALNDNPGSQRSWQTLAELQISQGRLEAAIKTLNYIEEEFGYSTGNALHHVWLLCITKQSTESNYQRFLDYIPNRKRTKYNDSSLANRQLMDSIVDESCPSISAKQHRDLMISLINSPVNSRELYNLHYLMIQSYINEGDLKAALASSKKLPNKLLRANYLLMQISIAFKLNDIDSIQSLYEKRIFLPQLELKTHAHFFKQIEDTLSAIEEKP